MQKITFPKQITLIILPEDFINTAFCRNTDCPMARALRRFFKEGEISNVHCGSRRGILYIDNIKVAEYDVKNWNDWGAGKYDEIKQLFKDGKSKEYSFEMINNF